MVDAPTGVLLVQLGTPSSPSVRDVRRYLREFLSDPRVLDVPAPVRTLLLHGIILPFRPRRSAKAYAKIWSREGSPLLLHTEALAVRLQGRLGDSYRVRIGMRYQSPPLSDAIAELLAEGVERLVVVPLFPQYSSAATGSAVERVFAVLGARANVPPVTVLGNFFAEPAFAAAVATVAGPLLEGFGPDYVLFSYHGLPEHQVKKADPGGWCLSSDSCCSEIRTENRFCYRAQCFATTSAIAGALDLGDGGYGTSFQSRLAGQRWIRPFTDHVLADLRERGVKRLAVLTPSFVADCLETLEEIGIRAREQWRELGGEDFLLVPCLNDHSAWVEALASLVEGVRP